MGHFLGIDPGLDGFLAVLSADGRSVLAALGAPVASPGSYDISGIWRVVSSLAGQINFCVIERQQAYPDQGGVSNFSTGYSYGLWRMALTAAAIPTEDVRPQAWKRAMDVMPPKAEDGSGDLKRAFASELDPERRKALKREIGRARAERRKGAKALTIAKVASLFPGLDLRATARCRTPHDGKAEAILLAELARRTWTGLAVSQSSMEARQKKEPSC